MNWLVVALCIVSLVAVFTIQTYTGLQLHGLSTTTPPPNPVVFNLSINNANNSNSTMVSSGPVLHRSENRSYENLWAFIGLTGIQMIIVAVSDVFTNWMFANSSFNIHRLMLSKHFQI